MAVDLILWLAPLAGLSTVLLVFRQPTVRDVGWCLQTRYPASDTSRLTAAWSIGATLLGATLLAMATRRARGFFTAVSAVLLLGFIGFWIRSHVRSDYLMLGFKPQGRIQKYDYFASDSGGVAVGYNYWTNSINFVDDGRFGTMVREVRKTSGEYPPLAGSVGKTAMRWGRTGFAIQTRPDPDATIQYDLDGRFLAAPYWFLAVVTAIAPAVWLRRTMRQRRRGRRGLCLVCGYDLRESPERCPECGTAIDEKH